MPSTFASLASGSGSLPAPQPNATASCVSCPAFMDPPKQQTHMGNNVGTNVCAVRLLSIGRPGSKTEQTAPKKLAPTCKEYNQPVTLADVHADPIPIEIAFPNMVAQSTPPNNPDSVNSCTSCAYFVNERVVEEGTGWTRTAFCSAKGVLMFRDRLPRYAKGCEFRSYDGGASALDYRPWSGRGITLLPELQEPVNKADPKFIIQRMRAGQFDDPRSFTNPEKPVSALARSLGIKAWRKIDDQTGFGPSVWLPVFDLEFMIEERERIFKKSIEDPSAKLPEIVPLPEGWDLAVEMAKVPQIESDEKPHKYIDHANLVYMTTVMWVRLGMTPAFWGPAGVGKTEFFRHIAWLMQLPFERVSINSSSEIDDIAGKMLYSPERGTYFHLGRVSRAWGKPNVLLVDEPNTGPPEVWQFLRPLTDNAKQLVLDQDRGQFIKAWQSCYLGMAMNPAWDIRNTGTSELADPDASRLMHITLDLPSEDIERAIIEQALLDDRWEDGPELKHVVDTLMKVAADLRRMSKEGTIPISWGIRNQIAVARVKRYLTWRMAYRVGAADALEPQVRDIVMESVNSFCKEGE